MAVAVLMEFTGIEAAEALGRDRLMPLAIKHGMTGPPPVTRWSVHNLLR